MCLAAMLTFSIWHLIAFISHKSAADEISLFTYSNSTPNTAASPMQAKSLTTWAATAPGRIKPKGGEVHIRAEARGIVREVLVNINDRVQHGDIIALIDDEQALARLSAARAEVQVRLAERAEEAAKEAEKAVLAWREALDDVAAAERQLHFARENLDQLLLERHAGKQVSDSVLASSRQKIVAAYRDISAKRQVLANIENKPNSPSSTRLDSGLAIARADLRLAEIAYEKTRIRATMDGMVLQMGIKSGEIANPTSPVPVAIIGKTDELEVTAEIEERNISQIRKSQAVEIRSSAFEGQKYFGKVVRLAPRVNVPGLGLRGSNEPRDVEVLEVDIAIEGSPPLLPGMRVDVFFTPLEPTQHATPN